MTVKMSFSPSSFQMPLQSLPSITVFLVGETIKGSNDFAAKHTGARRPQIQQSNYRTGGHRVHTARRTSSRRQSSQVIFSCRCQSFQQDPEWTALCPCGCRRSVSDASGQQRRGREARLPKFWAVEKMSKSFFSCRKMFVKKCKIGLCGCKNRHFRENQRQNCNFEHPIGNSQLFVEILPKMSSGCRKIATSIPA